MKQFLSILSSMRTMAILMLIFAASIGYATFIENDYGTVSAKADVYNARWFEVLLGLLTLNLILNIQKYKMYTLKKAPLFIFHIAFIIIIIGAATTRYIGYEGTMHIREGSSSNTMTSMDTYFSVNASIGAEKVESQESVYMSKRSSNSLSASLKVAGKKVSVDLLEYIPDAIETTVESKDGYSVLEFMVTGSGQGEPVSMVEGESYDSGTFILDFNSNKEFSKPVISIYKVDDKLYMDHKMPLKYLKMDDKSDGELASNDKEVFK